MTRPSHLGVTLAAAALCCACTSPARDAAAPEGHQAQALSGFSHKRVCAPGRHFCKAHLRTDLAGNRIYYSLPQGYGPADFASAYNFDPTRDPGATIAIVDAEGYSALESDLAAYRSAYGLPPCTKVSGCLTIVNQQGQPTPLPPDPQPDPMYGDWTEETALDVQMASAACPYCKLLVVQATGSDTAELANLFEAVNTAASFNPTVISNSWGNPEPDIASQANNHDPTYWEPHFVHPGIGIFVAAGDSGYDDGGAGADYPSSSAYVTAVGGTTLTKDSSARGWSEKAWNSGEYAGAGGSGCSGLIPKPSWQTDSACPKLKATADVSAVGDEQIAIYNNGPTAKSEHQGGWTVIGGTSASSPLVAAIYALTGNGAQDPSFAYLHTSAFYDVTSGNNGSCSPGVLCTCGAGWDGPTGVGTPNGEALAAAQGAVNGSTCGANTDCQSLHCVGGICCNSACLGPCQACSAGGLCTPVSASCDDGNACTSGDTCSNGACVGTPKDCGPAPAPCMLAPVCNPATAACEAAQPAPDGTGCDDGNPCTVNDACAAGACAGTPVSCPAPDTCHKAGTCDSASGDCPAQYDPLPDGTQCSDGNACTSGDTCHGGVCSGTPGVTCPETTCREAGSCDPDTGGCNGTPKQNGIPCDDGDRCTVGDACTNGTCSGTVLVCPAPDACHLDGACDPATGACAATYPQAADGTACDDHNPCTVDDACVNGACKGTPAAGACPADACHGAGTCDAATGACNATAMPDGTACDDGNICTDSDQCHAGVCTGTPVRCPAPDACHADGQCNPRLGCPVIYPSTPDGTPCDDHNACTTGDACLAGVCAGTPAVACPESACQLAGQCDPATGGCGGALKPDGTGCDDGNACTSNDRCQAGTCAGDPVTCPAPTACHQAGQCNWETGACGYPNLADGTACDDGNPATSNDQCQDGKCVGTIPGECSGKADGAACTGGTCKAGSCVAAPAPSKGCGCGSAGSSPASGLFGLAAALALWGRRRRG